jgi:tetratricopeptide (TPR) repeat protein
MARTTPPTLPETVSAALEHRISRLSEPCQRLLGHAAVLGGSFEFPLICAMEARRALPDEDLILNLLEEALQAGVLNEEGIGTRITYHFWHPLLVSYLYENLSAVRRLRAHKHVAEILQQMYQGREEEVAATITHHLIKGDADSAQIAHYAEMAANHAYALSANAEAVQYFWLAAERLGLVTRVDQGNMLFSMPYMQLAQLDTDTYAHHLSLLERLAECDMIRGNFTNARYLYELLLDWREQCPVYDPQYEAQIRALLWGEIGRTWRYAVNSDLAWQCCGRGEQVLLAVGVTDGPAWTRLRLFRCNLYLQEGRYDEVHRVASEILAYFEQQTHSSYEQAPSRRSAYTTRILRILQGDPADLGFVHRILGEIATREGQLSTGFTHLSTALAVFEQYGYKRETAHVACNLGYIHMKRAENEQAQAEFRRAFSLAESIDDDPLISVIFSDRGELAASQGNYQEAEDWYRKAMALLERTKDREYASRWNASLALVLQELGKEKEAVACAMRALLIGRATHTNPCIGMALVSIGTLRMMQARDKKHTFPAKFARLWSHACRDIRRALALEGVEAETRTTAQLVLAQLFLLSQDAQQARQQLNQAIESAQRYELVLVERQARELLSGL